MTQKLGLILMLHLLPFYYTASSITIDSSNSGLVTDRALKKTKVTKYKEEYVIIATDADIVAYDFEKSTQALIKVFSQFYSTIGSTDNFVGLNSTIAIYATSSQLIFLDSKAPSALTAPHYAYSYHGTFLVSISTFPGQDTFVMGTSLNKEGKVQLYTTSKATDLKYTFQNVRENRIDCETRKITPYNILCITISDLDGTTHYLLLSRDPTLTLIIEGNLNSVNLEPSTQETKHFKITSITETLFLLCIVKTDNLYCETGNIQESSITKDISKCKGCSEDYAIIISGCDSEHLSISLQSTTTFGVICKTSGDFLFSAFSIVEDPSSGERSFEFRIHEIPIVISEQATSIEIVSFREEFWLIFFVTSASRGKMEILNGANCQSVDIMTRVGTDITLIDFSKYVHGMNEYFPGYNSEVYMHFRKGQKGAKLYFGELSNLKELVYSDKYSVSTKIYFETQHKSMTYPIYFSVSQEEKITQTCLVTLYIRACHKACKTCENNSSDDDSTECKNGCYEGFYPLVDNLAQCYEEGRDVERYFPDETGKVFKKCSSACLKCKMEEVSDDSNCEECDVANDYYPHDNWESKCTKVPSEYFYFQNDKIYKCMEGCKVCSDGISCSTCDDYYKFLPSNSSCVNECNQVNNKKYLNLCVDSCPKDTIEKDGECLISNAECIAINNKIPELAKKNLTVSLFDGRSYCHSITLEEGSSNRDNYSSIYLGECEKILRDYYGISEKEQILLKKVELYRPSEITNQVEYQLFGPNGKELDLSLCSGKKIIISSPIRQGNLTIEEILEDAMHASKYGYDIFNSSDRFYTDVCTRFSSKDNTDVSIEDRKKSFYRNLSFCESTCEFSAVDLEAKRVNCSCTIKTSVSFEETKFSFSKLGKQFNKVVSNSNIIVIKCYDLVFDLGCFKGNIGSWLMITIIVIEVGIFVAYCFVGIAPLMKNISQIFKEKHESNPVKRKGKKDKNEVCFKNYFQDVNVPKIHADLEPGSKNKNSEFFSALSLSDNKKTKHEKSYMYSERSSSKEMNLINDTIHKNIRERMEITQTKNIDEIIKEKNYYNNYTDEELNWMNYEDSLANDYRSFCRIYYSKLKYTQLIIFTFFNSTDLNMRLLKIAMFLFSFAMFMAFNELYYSDSSMTRNYEQKGKFDFIYTLPQTIFSSLTSTIISFLLKFLSLTHDKIMKIREEKSPNQIKISRTVKCFRIKFLIFFTLSLAFLGLFWYYTSAFCAVFYQTQAHMILDTLISFSLTMIYPFGFSFLSALFRYIALKKHSKCCFFIQKFI